MPYYCVLDFECGGLNHETSAITEVAFVILDDNLVEIDNYQSYIFPYGLENGEQAIAVNGITDAKLLDDGKPIKDVAKEIRDMLKPYRDIVFVAHNAKFDEPFLKQFKTYGKLDIRGKFNPIPQCTMMLAKFLITGLKSYALGALCNVLEVEMENAHSALPDVRGTADVLRKLKNITGEKEETLTIEEVKKGFKL